MTKFSSPQQLDGNFFRSDNLTEINWLRLIENYSVNKEKLPSYFRHWPSNPTTIAQAHTFLARPALEINPDFIPIVKIVKWNMKSLIFAEKIQN